MKKASKTKQTAGKNSAKDNDIVAVIFRLLGDLPGVSVMEKFHHASFLVGKKVFAYMRPDGVVMKLPRERIEELLLTRADACHLVMGKRVMKEWMVIMHDDLNQYREDVKLFKEAAAFVRAVRKPKL